VWSLLLNENKTLSPQRGLRMQGNPWILYRSSLSKKQILITSDPTSIVGADSHSWPKQLFSKLDRVNQGNTLSERNIAVNERNEGDDYGEDSTDFYRSTGTKGRINSDGTVNVPRMENLLYEEDAAFQPAGTLRNVHKSRKIKPGERRGFK
jgi:hypothetical protein